MLVIIGMILAALVIYFAFQWDSDRFMRNRSGKALLPESKFVVTVLDDAVEVRRPDGSSDRVDFNDLASIYVVTTSEGPWSPDVWWVLTTADEKGGVLFPSGATGEDHAMKFMQDLEGFDNEAAVTAMGSTADCKFLCWQRPPNYSLKRTNQSLRD